MNLRGRDLLSVMEFTADEIVYILDLARELKIKKKKNIPVDTLRGKNAAFIFRRPGVFVKAAADTAAHDLGICTTIFSGDEAAGFSEEESKNAARALSDIYDAVLYRGHFQDAIERFAAVSSVPVWNGGNNEADPIQILADIMTIGETFGKVRGKKLVYLGNARGARAASMMTACAKLGMHYAACSPENLFPVSENLGKCESLAEESGGSVTLSGNITTVIRGADIIYTDSSQVSTLEDAEELRKYGVVTEEMLSAANEGVIYLNALPVSNPAPYADPKGASPAANLSAISKTFDQNENLMHVMKAVMAATLGAI